MFKRISLRWCSLRSLWRSYHRQLPSNRLEPVSVRSPARWRLRLVSSLGPANAWRAVSFPNGGGPPEAYVGVMGTIGLDVGITAGGVMAWGVLAPTAGPKRGALAGTYVGASGAIGVGVGVGANLLFGGTGRSIALQPLSVEGSVGINLSLGVSSLTLSLAQ